MWRGAVQAEGGEDYNGRGTSPPLLSSQRWRGPRSRSSADGPELRAGLPPALESSSPNPRAAARLLLACERTEETGGEQRRVRWRVFWGEAPVLLLFCQNRCPPQVTGNWSEGTRRRDEANHATSCRVKSGIRRNAAALAVWRASPSAAVACAMIRRVSALARCPAACRSSFVAAFNRMRPAHTPAAVNG